MMDKWPGLQKNLLVHRWKRTTSSDGGCNHEEGVERKYIGEKTEKNTYMCELMDILPEGLLKLTLKHRNNINTHLPTV